jgi:hypothetical protein
MAQNRILYVAILLALVIALAIVWHFTHVPSSTH